MKLQQKLVVTIEAMQTLLSFRATVFAELDGPNFLQVLDNDNLDEFLGVIEGVSEYLRSCWVCWRRSKVV